MGALRNFGMSVLSGAALTMAICAGPALADDPRDPAMTAREIARDRAEIRRLNQAQLDYVRQRDAGYAQQWADHEAARGYSPASDHTRSMRGDYAEQRRRYEDAMRDWREDVAACRAGDYDRCAAR